jgi:hypothetical protein
MSISIPLSKGHVTVIDDCDHDLAALKWHARKSRDNFYASHYAGNRVRVHLHRAVLARALGRPLEAKEYVDHIDGDSLNNTRNNLRIANHAQNGANQRVRSNNKSGYKGVSWCVEVRKWRAHGSRNGKRVALGSFDSPEDAYKAYLDFANSHYGEFATDGRSHRHHSEAK